MHKIKVNFHISTLFFGGIELVLLRYLQYFDRSRYEVSLSIGRKMGDELEILISKVPLDVKITYLVKSKTLNNIKIKKKLTQPYSALERILDNLLFKWMSRATHAFRFYNLSKKYDLIIDFDLFSGRLYSSKPVITVLHFNLNSQINKLKDKQHIIKRFKQSSAIITLNDEMKAECVAMLPDFASKIQVIYNSFNFNEISKLSNEVDDFLISMNYVVTVCRLEESQKDVTTLIKAFKIIVEDFSYGGNLIIVGHGSSYDILNDLVHELKINERIIFVGRQDNPYKFMRNAELFVLSSKFEGLPSVLIEAMICDVPIISTLCPVGVADILQNGNCGLLVNVGDVNALASAMNELLTNSILGKKLLDNSSSRVKDFAIDVNINKFYELINGVINNKYENG